MVGWKRLEVILLLLIYYDLIMKCISTIISRKSLSSASYAYPPISSVEYDSLYNFFLDTNGPQWTWQSSPVINSTSLFNASIPWNFTIYDLLAPCNNDWQGIVCSCSVSNCSISEILLTSHNLTGHLPDTIANLTELTNLRLDGNFLSGSLPDSLTKLSFLTTLNLSFNNFNGTLPFNFGKLANLTHLSLSNNFFRGEIPQSLYRLKTLKYLGLEVNSFYGRLHSDIDQLQSLEDLLLYNNYFYGDIPSSIGNITSLRTIFLDYNELHGILPSSLGNLRNLTALSVNFNFIKGPIPIEITYLTKLTELSLSGNFFTILPNEIGNLINLQFLYLGNNIISGSLPVSLGNLTKLRVFSVPNNSFYGRLPLNWPNENSSNLISMNLGNNILSGTIPEMIPYYCNILLNFEIYNNGFYGSIPTSFSLLNHSLIGFISSNNFLYGNNTHFIFADPMDSEHDNKGYHKNNLLEFLDLETNSFSGLLPSGNWPFISFYVIASNYYEGNISHLFQSTNSRELYYFDVSCNALIGTIPASFSSLSFLAYFNVSINFFTGTLNYSNVIHSLSPLSSSEEDASSSLVIINLLEEYDVSYNYLYGRIPDAFGLLPNLLDLVLNNNDFTGSLPSSFFNLTKLQVLFLQNNQFTGDLSLIEQMVSLNDLDVSNNQFTGYLPSFSLSVGKSLLQTFAATSNCLSGSIPVTYCQLTSFITLALDGISTATSCRTAIFPGSSLLNAFYIHDYLSNGIPFCLFTDLPVLQTLHVSGNGLTGSLPSSFINISSNLNDLSLSHNQLTGTIPTYFQQRSWLNLDLSYNKLTGTLIDSFPAYDSNSSLTLEINRLSGYIPSSLLDSENINILQGKLTISCVFCCLIN
jgi:Leucine-rich repeat (LRR) protein